MKLHLKNFKSHVDYKLTLPNTGMILLSGEKGAGKSSILDAIYFALYGDRSIRPTRINSTRCTVKMSWMGLSILRSTGKPTRLQVNGEEDSVAQELINSKLMERSRFCISSYIRQKCGASILTSTPAEQIKLLHALAFGDSAVHVNLIKSIGARIRTDEIALTVCQTELEQLNEREQELQLEIKELSSSVLFDADRIKKARSFLERVGEVTARLETELTSSQNKLNSIRDASIRLESLLSTETKLAEELDSLKSIHDLPTLLGQKDRLLGVIDRMRRDKELHNKRNAILARVNELNLVVQNSPKVTEEDLVLVKERLNDAALHQQLLQLFKKLPFSITKSSVDSVKAKLENYTKPGVRLVCPECRSDLCLIDEALTHRNSENDITEEQWVVVCKAKRLLSSIERWPKSADVDLVKAELKSVEQELKQKELTKTHLELALKQLSETRELTYSDRDLVQSTNIYEANLSMIATAELVESRRQDLNKRLKAIKLEKAKLNSLVGQEVDSKDSFNSVTQIVFELQTKLTRLRKQERLATEISAAGIQLDHLQTKKEKLEKMVDRIRLATKKVNKLSDSLITAHRLLELSRRSATIAIEKVVRRINSGIGYYLERMFPKETPYIRLCFAEKKTGKVVLKLDICYKGLNYKRLQQLSGGEWDLMVLASLLAVNELVNSPIIMLDESLASLDSNTNTDVLEFLKEHARKKLLLVCSHEAIEGIFDKVIQV